MVSALGNTETQSRQNSSEQVRRKRLILWLLCYDSGMGIVPFFPILRAIWQQQVAKTFICYVHSLVKEIFHCSFLAFKADLRKTEHLRCPTLFNRETTYSESSILTLRRNKRGHKNWANSSTDQTTQNARPQGIKAIATLTHCWMPCTYSLATVSASPSGLRQGKKTWGTNNSSLLP